MSMEFWLVFFAGPVVIYVFVFIVWSLVERRHRPKRPDCEICGQPAVMSRLSVNDDGISHIDLCRECLEEDFTTDGFPI